MRIRFFQQRKLHPHAIVKVREVGACLVIGIPLDILPQTRIKKGDKMVLTVIDKNTLTYKRV